MLPTEPGVALLPRILQLRVDIAALSFPPRRLVPVEKLKLLARSQLGIADSALLTSLISSANGQLVDAAVNAAFYDGGISGFGGALHRWLAKGDAACAGLGTVALTLAVAVVDCHDVAAARALSHADRKRTDIEEALGLIYASMPYDSFQALADQRSTYAPNRIIALLAEGRKGKARPMWLLKQFIGSHQARACILELQEDVAVGPLASFIGAQFFGAKVDLRAAAGRLLRAANPSLDDARRVLNALLQQYFYQREGRTLQRITSLVDRFVAKEELADLMAWIERLR